MNFRDERGPDGKTWKASLRAAGENGQTLTLTARLKNSINYRVNNDSVSVGTSVSYAAIHQLGFTGTVQVSAHERRITQAFGKKLKKRKTVTVKSHAAKRNIPARPFLPMTLEEVGTGEVERILIRHLVKE
jgi:phage gpG-like protein